MRSYGKRWEEQGGQGVEITAPWRYPNEGEALHFMVRDGSDQRRIKLKRSDNAALYDFLVERATSGSEPVDSN